MSVEKFKCNSFVFIDLETTGLPFHEDDGGNTKVTEICLISIPRETLSKVHQNDLPRNLHKLTVTINPKKPISDKAREMTDLDNVMLENEYPFDEKKAAVIKSFLDQCKPPLCLVAHNGNRFDFPILKEELKPFSNIIPEDTRCADTWLAFRELFYLPEVDPRTYFFNPFINDIDVELIKASEDTEIKLAPKLTEDTMIENVNMTRMKMLNETTPPSQKILSTPSLNSHVTFHKKKLFVDQSAGETNGLETKCQNQSAGDTNGLETKCKNQSFALSSVYERIFGVTPPCSHRAEDDTITMIKCCLRFGSTILDHFDRNSKLYSTINPIYFERKTNI